MLIYLYRVTYCIWFDICNMLCSVCDIVVGLSPYSQVTRSILTGKNNYSSIDFFLFYKRNFNLIIPRMDLIKVMRSLEKRLNTISRNLKFIWQTHLFYFKLLTDIFYTECSDVPIFSSFLSYESLCN